jgi:polysaccharide biosynthesis transport protein
LLEETEERNLEPIDWHSHLALVRRRRWLLLLTFFAGWLIVWGVSWLLPSIYRSGTLILAEQPTLPRQFVAPHVASDSQDRSQTITQQILSRTRLLHIIDNLSLYAKERQRLSADNLVERMRKDIEIESARNENNQLTAFNIYYSSRDPRVAQQVTSELTNLFVSENLEARQAQSENTTKFLESELEEARKNLGEQEEKVRQFKGRHFGELPGQLQRNPQIFTGLQNQLQSEEKALNRAKQQNVYLESLLGQHRNFPGLAKTGIADGRIMGLPALDPEHEKLRAQLTDLSAHYTRPSPDVRELNERATRGEKTRDQPAANLTSGAAAARLRDTEPMMEVESQLKGNRIEIATRQRAIEDVKSKIGEYQARLNRSPMMEQKLADLTRGYDQSKANYNSLLKRRNDSVLATSLELKQQGGHFRVLDPPSLPVKPYSPNRLKFCAIGLAVGLLLSGAATLGAELLDDRIYDGKLLRKLIQIPVLSEIPNFSTDKEKRAERRDGWLVWATASLMAVSIFAGTALSYFRG